MELSLAEVIVRILNDVDIRSVVVKVQHVSQSSGSLLLQKKNTGQYIAAIDNIDMCKIEKCINYFLNEVAVIPQNSTLPKDITRKFENPITGILLPSNKLKIGYDVVLAAFWNGPFCNYVFTRQISNDDKNILQRVSDVFHDQLASDELLRHVILK